MRSPLRHTRWTLAALIFATSCKVHHSLESAASEPEPPAANAQSIPALASEIPPPSPATEPEAARCARYHRQQAFTVPPGPRSANGANAQPLSAPSGVSPEIAPATPRIAQGPVLGAIAADGVKVWLRTETPANWHVKVWLKSEAETSNPAFEVAGPPLTAAGDFAASVRVSGLAPRTAYAYAVSLRTPGADHDEPIAARGEFHTLAPDGEPTRTRVVIGADITGSGPQPIFKQIGDVQPDFMLFIGDQVYADAAEPTPEGYATFYRHNWNIKYLRPLLQNVPAFMIWDDHEIQDNFWLGKSDRYAPARAAYEVYVHAHNPAAYRNDALYYTMRSGDVAFFVLDVRSYRSSNKLPDDEHKTMLGAQQKRDLVDWLTCEPARLKVVVSPVIWNDWAMTRDDAWQAFTTEREELLAYVANQHIGKVLFVSGDQHWSAIFRFVRDDYAFYEFLPTPLSKTRAVAPTTATDEILARDDDNFVFGVVDIDTTVDPAAIALTLCALDKPCRPGEEPAPGTGLDVEGDSENVPFTVHLTSRDLGRPDE